MKPDSMPPSPFDQAGGLAWLPRLLEKARRGRSGGLGVYLLFEDSPLDAWVMAEWRVTGDQIMAWMDEGLDPDAIAARIGAAMGAPDVAAREAWSRSFGKRWGWFWRAIDADEGRLPDALERTLLVAMLTATFKTVELGLKLRGRR